MPAKHSDQAEKQIRGRFQKGQSGNPGGRPRVALAFKERCRQFMDDEGVDRLLALARADSEFALKLLAEYGYGKPTQPVSGDEEAAPIRVSVTFDDASDAA